MSSLWVAINSSGTRIKSSQQGDELAFYSMVEIRLVSFSPNMLKVMRSFHYLQ